MRMFLLLGPVLALSLPIAAQPVLAPETLFERTSTSVWVVRTLDAEQRPLRQGSAVVIGPGRLVTNCHVLRQARGVLVARDNVSYGATLEYPDPERDLCQLKVANFTAQPVVIAGMDSLKVGARVYAIGNPRSLETTLSDGLISGLRRTAQDQLEAIQITVPLSAGSSGGGLFDAHGRLIGITTYGLRESQNLNFALPAAWIAEVPERAQAALAARNAPRTPLTQATPVALPSGDRVFEYRLLDRQTGVAQTIVYRLDRVDGDKLVFNQGSRVERAGGGLVSIQQPLGGEFDLVSPPEGWVPRRPEPGATWRLDYSKRVDARTFSMDLTATVMEESTMTIGQRTLPIVRVEFRGYTQRGQSGFFTSGAYLANAWYAPDLARTVRFDVKTRFTGSGGTFFIDEQLELVDIRSE